MREYHAAVDECIEKGSGACRLADALHQKLTEQGWCNATELHAPEHLFLPCADYLWLTVKTNETAGEIRIDSLSSEWSLPVRLTKVGAHRYEEPSEGFLSVRCGGGRSNYIGMIFDENLPLPASGSVVARVFDTDISSEGSSSAKDNSHTLIFYNQDFLEAVLLQIHEATSYRSWSLEIESKDRDQTVIANFRSVYRALQDEENSLFALRIANLHQSCRNFSGG